MEEGRKEGNGGGGLFLLFWMRNRASSASSSVFLRTRTERERGGGERGGGGGRCAHKAGQGGGGEKKDLYTQEEEIHKCLRRRTEEEEQIGSFAQVCCTKQCTVPYKRDLRIFCAAAMNRGEGLLLPLSPLLLSFCSGDFKSSQVSFFVKGRERKRGRGDQRGTYSTNFKSRVDPRSLPPSLSAHVREEEKRYSRHAHRRSKKKGISTERVKRRNSFFKSWLPNFAEESCHLVAAVSPMTMSRAGRYWPCEKERERKRERERELGKVRSLHVTRERQEVERKVLFSTIVPHPPFHPVLTISWRPVLSLLSPTPRKREVPSAAPPRKEGRGRQGPILSFFFFPRRRSRSSRMLCCLCLPLSLSLFPSFFLFSVPWASVRPSVRPS